MEVWQVILGIFFGIFLLVISSEKTIDQLIKISSLIGVSTFTVGFIIASLGSDMPELVNSLFSSYLGHGDISVGDSIGSVMTQITLVLGLIPFSAHFVVLFQENSH